MSGAGDFRRMRAAARTRDKCSDAMPRSARLPGNDVAWLLLGACALAAGAWLRLSGIGGQIVIDDEWHALHKLLRADLLDILTHLDYADYSIPLTVYFRALYDTVGITEWGMRAPMLVAGIALVAAAPLLARPWASAPVRATWAVLLAVSPLLVYTSRTARPYALTALLATLALIAFERWHRGDGRRDAWGAALRRGDVPGRLPAHDVARVHAAAVRVLRRARAAPRRRRTGGASSGSASRPRSRLRSCCCRRSSTTGSCSPRRPASTR